MKQPEQKVVFLTGGTGHVGRNLIPVLLESQNTTLVLLIRGRSDSDARARVAELFLGLAGSLDLSRARERVRAVRGDVTQERLGMSEDRYQALAGSVTHIVHSAATVKFRTPLDEAREIDVEGTRRVMEFARLARRRGRPAAPDELDTLRHRALSFLVRTRGKSGYAGQLQSTGLHSLGWLLRPADPVGQDGAP
jgi:NAD(P)-dependent dehydrogenase (short-subunit alcohol dehydrogenase family)